MHRIIFKLQYLILVGIIHKYVCKPKYDYEMIYNVDCHIKSWETKISVDMDLSIWNIFVIMFGDEEVVMCPSNVWSPHVLMCNKISSNIKTFTRQRVLQMVGKYSITKIFLIAHVGISFALFDRSQEYWMIYPLHILTAWKH